MLDGMRVPILLLVNFALIFPNQPMHAQGSTSDRIERAKELRDEGQPKAAIVMIEPMLQPPVERMVPAPFGLSGSRFCNA
jgi:hypothetical protein